METQYAHLKRIYEYFEKPSVEALNKSLRDVHVDGLFSLVINGVENGKLTRVFIATKKVKPQQIQLHSHRYGIKLTPLNGEVVEHTWGYCTHSKDLIKVSQFVYKSPLNGGNGLQYNKDVTGIIRSKCLPLGGTTQMSGDSIHTISCNKGSIWIVEEQGFTTEESIVLGVPFTTANLYNEPKQYEVNDNFQLVKGKLKSILNSYENL